MLWELACYVHCIPVFFFKYVLLCLPLSAYYNIGGETLWRNSQIRQDRKDTQT